MLPPKELAPLLGLMLTLLTIHAISSTIDMVEVPLRPMIRALEDDHDVPIELAKAVMNLFGEVDTGAQMWRADVGRMVAEVGRGLLANLSSQGRSMDSFMSEWREQVGETWEGSIDLKLLEVSFSPPLTTSKQPDTVKRATTSSMSHFPQPLLILDLPSCRSQLTHSPYTQPHVSPTSSSPDLDGVQMRCFHS